MATDTATAPAFWSRVRNWLSAALAFFIRAFKSVFFPTARPVTLGVDYPEKLSRVWVVLKALFGSIYVGIPHGIALALYQIAVGIVTFIAFWVVLFTGKYPRGMFDFVVGYIRWTTRVTAYLSLLRDEYPPFSGKP